MLADDLERIDPEWWRSITLGYAFTFSEPE